MDKNIRSWMSLLVALKQDVNIALMLMSITHVMAHAKQGN